MAIWYGLPYIEMILPTKHLPGICSFHSQRLWSITHPIPTHLQTLPPAAFFGEQKTPVNKVKFKCVKVEESKLVPLTIKYVGLASLAWCRVPVTTPTCNIHREKLKFLCPLPSANWTRFSSLVGYNIYEEYEETENQHIDTIYLFIFILMEGVWFR